MRGKELDARTDLFSFGAVLYEMATGQLPFRGDTAGVIFKSILDGTPTSAVRLNADLPPRLEDIIHKCPEKKRNLRYQHASEIRTDLQRLKRDTESAHMATAQPPEVFRRPRFSWRDKPTLIIGGMVLAAVLGLASWFFGFRGRGEAIDSIAVLPFVNASADPNTEYLSDGVTENLINSFSQLPNLRVIPRSRVFGYKERDGSRKDRGSTDRQSDATGRQPEFQTELVDVAADSQLWGRQYNRRFFRDHHRAGGNREGCFRKTGPADNRRRGEEEKRLTKRYTEKPEAQQLYLKGRYVLIRESGSFSSLRFAKAI